VKEKILEDLYGLIEKSFALFSFIV